MKRFYKAVTVAPEDGGWRVLLDARGIKTVGGRPQVLPTRALAEAMAEEWADQAEELDPAGFILRDLADYAIDVVGEDRAGTIRGLVAFAGTDTLCYRAEPDEPLRERQDEVWEPFLQAAEHRWDVHFERVDGIIHRPQPAATLARMEAVLAAESDHALAALNTLTSLAASLVIGLAALAPEAKAELLWDAANLEEDWQVELWGKDYEAEALRERRLATFAAAMRFARLARQEP
ncbi:MAG: molecular chaperone [Novosphingobium sp.]|nr:molecular chaperone [Novosphingobium sp.]